MLLDPSTSRLQRYAQDDEHVCRQDDECAMRQDDAIKKATPSPYADHDHIRTKVLSGQRAQWPG